MQVLRRMMMQREPELKLNIYIHYYSSIEEGGTCV